MAIPTSNAGSTYFNTNQCRSFLLHLTTGLTQLSGGFGDARGQPCSEVTIYNGTGALVYVYDRAVEYTASVYNEAYKFMLSSGESFTFRGLTNVDQVSAKTSSGTGEIYYRTQFFSSNPKTA